MAYRGIIKQDAVKLLIIAAAIGCSSARQPGEIPAEWRLDDFSRSRLEWNRYAGALRYEIVYTSGFGIANGPMLKRQTVSLVLERPNWVEVSGDSVISTTYRYHPWRLAAPTQDDTVVQPSIGLLELAPFKQKLNVGAQDQDVTQPTNGALNFQSRRSTRINAVDAREVSYTTTLEYRIPVTQAANALASELWNSEKDAVLARLGWLTQSWTPYGVCEARYDRVRGLLIRKRCAFHHLSDHGATVDSVRTHPSRMEVVIQHLDT